MSIKITTKAAKQLKKLPKMDQIAVAQKIRNIPTLFKDKQVTMLSGYKNTFRVRVGNIRIVELYKSKDYFVVLIAHRKEIYKILNQMSF